MGRGTPIENYSVSLSCSYTTATPITLILFVTVLRLVRQVSAVSRRCRLAESRQTQLNTPRIQHFVPYGPSEGKKLFNRLIELFLYELYFILFFFTRLLIASFLLALSTQYSKTSQRWIPEWRIIFASDGKNNKVAWRITLAKHRPSSFWQNRIIQDNRVERELCYLYIHTLYWGGSISMHPKNNRRSWSR